MINFHSNEKIKTAIPKYSQKHLIKDEIVDFQNDTIKIDSLDSSKSILKLFVIIDGQKVGNNNDNNLPNFYIIKLKDYEAKDEFHELNIEIMNSFEINLELKVKNIIGGGGFKARMSMFQTKPQKSSEPQNNVINTKNSMKDRLNLYNNNNQKPKLKKSVTSDILNIKFKQANENTEHTKNIISKEKIKEEKIDNEIKINEINNERNKNIKEDKKKEEKIDNKIKNNEITNEKNKEEKKDNIIKNNEASKERNKNIIKDKDKEEKIDNEIKNNEISQERNKNLKNEKNKEEKVDNVIKNNEITEERNKNIKNEKNKEEKKEIVQDKVTKNIKEKTINRNLTQNIVDKKPEPIKKITPKEKVVENKENINKKPEIKNSTTKELNSKKLENNKKKPEEKAKNLNNQKVNKKTQNTVVKEKNKKVENKNIAKNYELKNFEKYHYKDEWEYDDDSNNNIENENIYKEEEDIPEEYYEEKEQDNSPIDKGTKLNKKNDEKIDKNTQKRFSLGPNEDNQKSVLKTKTFPSKKNQDETKNPSSTDLGFEVLENVDEDIQPSSTMNSSMDSIIPDNILESMNYEIYLSELKKYGKKEIPHETFCSGFFLASFPKKNGQVIENLAKFPASCGHSECSQLPPMKPEIIFRYPLKDTKNLELNNLAATICFPAGIKMCYSEDSLPKKIDDYVAQITNQKGERYYMRTFHFYEKMSNIDFTKNYEIHPLKHHLSKFGDEYLFLKDEQYTEEITKRIENILEFCEGLGFRDIVYIPCCICLISKYPYISELDKCLETIYSILEAKPGLLDFEINDLIMYLINSIPVPDKNMSIQFFLPYSNNPKTEIQCPKIDDISITNSNYIAIFKYLSVDNIILIFRLLLSEKKLLFIHDDYTELTNITNSFISLLYPFQWIHTYIPIMSAEMLKYLETFLPFLNGIHTSLMTLVEKIFKDEIEESEEIFLIYIKKNEINLSSSFKNNKNKASKYIQSTIPNLPFEKELKKELKVIESSKKQLNNELLENKLRDAFINIFVKMFYDYDKYIINLDNDVVFNKVLFMKNLPSKEEKTEKFFEEFVDSQLFQQFSQNLFDSENNENSYFKIKIKEFKEKNMNTKKGGLEKTKTFTLNNNKNIIYFAFPYLGIKNSDAGDISKIINSYKISEEENKKVKNKILENEINIQDEKYVNKKCIIYLTPEKREMIKEDKNKDNKKNKKIDVKEKQIEQIKDDIKDIVINIFKSQIEDSQIKSLKKKVFNDLETPEGKTFFVYLISNHKYTIISLQEASFFFLSELIKGFLYSVLKSEETEELIEEIAKLIISTKYYETEVNQNTKENKTHLTIFAYLKKFFAGYNKITQKTLWKKWYELELIRKNQECSDEDENKESIILDICNNMIFLELSKSTVKNITESVNKIAFEEGFELYEKVKIKYIELITKAKYISEVSE